ncbi:MAG: helix-turn-helix domain-containing protein [Patescibacteria group bacterium]|jgi:sugar-specific transcriptional regulator TrmB
MKNMVSVFKSLGFLESEIKTYLTTLELGQSTVLEISSKTKLSRQTTYMAIESLIKQGMMTSVQKGKKTYFAAESPERLRSYAEAKLKSMEATVREIKVITNELKLMENGEKPVVKMYEGMEGYISQFNDILKCKPEKMYNLSNEDMAETALTSDELKPYKEQMDRLNISIDMMSIANLPHTYRKLTKHKRITRKDLNFEGDVIIYKDRVALSTYKGKRICVLIENKILADTMLALFKLAWENDNK